MHYTYRPKGVCTTKIDITAEDGKIQDVVFTGGCSGNTQGVARLVRGRSIAEVIAVLEGTRCGSKQTSCPDQLAAALKELANKE